MEETKIKELKNDRKKINSTGKMEEHKEIKQG
jgi:hypothetical protein